MESSFSSKVVQEIFGNYEVNIHHNKLLIVIYFTGRLGTHKGLDCAILVQFGKFLNFANMKLKL